MLIVGILSIDSDYARNSAFDVIVGFLADGPDWPQVLVSDWPLFPLLDMFAKTLDKHGYRFTESQNDIGAIGCGNKNITSILQFLPGDDADTAAARYFEDLTH